MTYSLLPYIMTEAFCLIYALSIFLSLSPSIGTEHEINELKNMIYAYIMFLISDMAWSLIEGKYVPSTPAIHITVSTVMIISISFGGFFWCKFMADRLFKAKPLSKKWEIILSLPIIMIIAMDILSIFTGFLFYIDAQGHYQSTNYFFIQTFVNNLYIIVPTIASIVYALRTTSRTERKEYLIYSTYLLVPVIMVEFEDVLPNVPLLALSIFMIIHILFLMIQNSQIYNDALTGLNNRRRVDQYLDYVLPKASEENPVTIMIIDINGFKSINDTYGHIEGDRALRTFAYVLKDVAMKHHAFISRYGGDEFCLVKSQEADAKEIADDLQTSLREYQMSTDIAHPYILTASIGYTQISEPSSNTPLEVKKADIMLYENKMKWHKSQH